MGTQHFDMEGRVRKAGADRPRTPQTPRDGPAQQGGLLGLQQAAGNAAVVRLLSSANVQRDPGSSDPEPGTVGGTIPLAEAIETHFTTAPYHPPSLVSLIQSAALAQRDEAFADASMRKTVIDALDEEDRARVFSALLAGRVYQPDYESAIFQTYTTTKADEVSDEVNRRFTAAVGISRALDWSSSLDKPLARYWLRLRDDVVREEIESEEERQFRDEVLAALATSTDDAVSVIESALPEHVAAALADAGFMRSLRDASTDFEAFARLAETLGREPPYGFDLKRREAVRTAFSEAWADSDSGPDGHEEGGWIYLNLVTGSITTERADSGGAKSIDLSLPPVVEDSVLIGTFHTHPIPGEYQGYYSSHDFELARDKWKVPSAIIPGEWRSKWFGVEVRERLTGGQTFPTY